ncbi:Uma2 family endonuclease [Moraxella sp. ZY210820]|uniref:Uma2 family endonuclease n=1 Tax=unclassified Moraxella TaxID=2685852 RepID=UPI0027306C66|nr:Uma2 family endonuclease [Moraxella sp. ZY210820]WLF83844.1 Uma2 family endonuclease [Moraxella sp. ZY210820]
MTTLILPTMSFLWIKNNEQSYISQKTNTTDFLHFLESNPNERFELVDGMIIPMSNASPRHGKIMTNFSGKMIQHLTDTGSPCFYFSDMQCKIDEFNCPHPDILVVCNESVDSDLLKYPTLVGEIHSPNNRNNDFNKLSRYKKCSSIQEIMMIEQDKIAITVYTRQGQDWLEKNYVQDDILILSSIDLEVKVNDLYARVKF